MPRPSTQATVAATAPVTGQAQSYLSSAIFMDTLVSVEVVGESADAFPGERADRALGWFREVESRCSRFEPESELMRLCRTVGQPVTVSPLLFRVLEFALAVAKESGGAFDPGVGAAMVRRGFDLNYRTGQHTNPGEPDREHGTWRDLVLDGATRTATLRRPVALDLGAVAKGFAIDLAAAEVAPFPGCAINAGGDIYVRGPAPEGGPWRVGIRHPRQPGALADELLVSGVAVCTSGDYERGETGDPATSHIVSPHGRGEAAAAISVTVVASSAMLADALATAAYVLGARNGLAFLQKQGVEGIIITSTLERLETPGFARYRK